MTVLITVDVHGQTREGYDGMIAVLEPLIKQAPGFLMHGAYETEDGQWRVFEVWAAKEDSDRFFAQHIAPILPPGVRPKRTVHALYGFVPV